MTPSLGLFIFWINVALLFTSMTLGFLSRYISSADNLAIPLFFTGGMIALTLGILRIGGIRSTFNGWHLIPVFVYFANTPEFHTVTAQTPKLKDWWQKVSQLPVVQKVCG